MIEFKNVTKIFPESERPAVDNLNFKAESGELCVLIGPSGCGKTTTLRMVNRMAEATSGQILVNGEDIRSYAKEQLRRSIGYVIQSVGLLPHLQVNENISLVPKLLGWEKKRRNQRADELLTMVGLNPAEYREKYAHELSGGEAQRVGVARALAAKPKLLLMDEPFGAVDPLRRETLQKEFLELQHTLGISVLFVTHDLDEAIRLADKIVLMSYGKIVQSDRPEQLLAHPANEFVRQFIGADRALKRLGCFKISDHLKKSYVLQHSELGKNGTIGHKGTRPLWVVDRRNQLVGLIDSQSNNGAMIDFPTEYRQLNVQHTLKEALSRMLGMGISAVPVVDAQLQLIGEVRLSDIEKINQSGIDL